MRGFLGGASGKEPAGDVRDAVSIPGLRKSLSGGHGNPLLYSCLENPLGKEACQATVQRVAHNWSDLACMFVLNSEKREIWIKYLLMAFPGSSEDKESACSAGDLGSIPGLRRSPEEGNDNPLQYAWLENSMNRAACWATVHSVTRCTRLSD